MHCFHSSGHDEACEPQPIPPLLVGHDKEWLSLSPHTVKYWVSAMPPPPPSRAFLLKVSIIVMNIFRFNEFIVGVTNFIRYLSFDLFNSTLLFHFFGRMN